MDTVEKGQAADRLLNDPVLAEAFEMAGARFIQDWMDGKTAEDREAAWAKQAGLAEVEKMIRAMISDAVAEVEIRKRQNPQDEN